MKSDSECECSGKESSLSARRVWIEIDDVMEQIVSPIESLSARRVWIEIPVRRW